MGYKTKKMGWLATSLSLIALNSAVGFADVPKGVKGLLTTAASKGDKAAFDIMFKAALDTYPGERINIFKLVKSINPAWLDAAHTKELDDLAAADAAAEKASRDRGIWYYLDPVLWNGQVQVGANVSSGDTSQQAGNIGLSFNRKFGTDWEHGFRFNFDYARRDGSTVQERFIGQYDGLWRAWEKGFVSNFTQLEIDQFSGFDYRLTETISIGYQLIDNDRHKLRLEAGPGIRLNKELDIEEVDPVTGDLTLIEGQNRTEVIGRISSTYDLKLSENVTFTDTASAIFGGEFTSLRNVAQLSTKLTDSLALRLSFEANYDSPVPENTSKFDTISRISVSYDF
jgi:putative salt-induced outer membrane protein